MAKNLSPFARNGGGSDVVTGDAGGAMAGVSSDRAVAEVQASMAMAKRFPRSQRKAMDNLLEACTRPSLASGAIYAYKRGTEEVSGPSIRLAEVAAQNWGNLDFGVEILSQRAATASTPGMSTVRAFAKDLETNVSHSITFEVPHVRHTKNGTYPLTSPRDIYEAEANYGARRLRKCLLSVIPGDVMEAAVQECERTLIADADTSPEATKRMTDKFETIGVSKEMIEKRIGRRLASIRPAQVINLRKVFTSISEGATEVGEWFEMDAEAHPATKLTVATADLDGVPDSAQPATVSATNGKAAVSKGPVKAASPVVDDVPDVAAATASNIADIDDIPDVQAPPAEMTAEAKAIQALGKAAAADALDEIMAGLDEAVARLPLVLKTYDARKASFADGVLL